MVPTSEDLMEQRAPGSSSTPAANAPAAKTSHRNVWVVTAYAITGLAVFGVLAYYLSTYLAR
jgi:ABC-type multidrug transport system permease subunit